MRWERREKGLRWVGFRNRRRRVTLGKNTQKKEEEEAFCLLPSKYAKKW